MNEVIPKLAVVPVDTTSSFRVQAYESLKRAITQMDIYGHRGEIRLDERQLSQDLGVSRTPIREAMSLLEQEGFVRTVPRRGIFVVRKTKAEIIEMIYIWAALESMSARLATQRASDEAIASLRKLFIGFESSHPKEHMDEYSEANVAFHQAIIRLGGCKMIDEITKNLFIHMRAIRQSTIGQDNRADRSMMDHLAIIEALERRETEKAEGLVRQHTLDLAAHVERYCAYLD
ncbi:MAG: GntR family transcriptional regulator [Bacteroidota bacterium]|nr:GntR family transcriptional regulator [Kiloniellaceae bacterium]